MLSSRAPSLPDSPPRTAARPAGPAPSQAAPARALSLLTFEDELDDSPQPSDWYSDPPPSGDGGPEPDYPGGEMGSCANRTDSPPGPGVGVGDCHPPFESGDTAHARPAFYDLAVRNVRNAVGLDVNGRSHALQDALDMLRREQECPPSRTVTNPPA